MNEIVPRVTFETREAEFAGAQRPADNSEYHPTGPYRHGDM
jgi:hypothetical protein